MVNRNEHYNTGNSDTFKSSNRVYTGNDFYNERSNVSTARAYNYIPEVENDDSEIQKRIRRDKQQDNAREERARQSRLRRLERSIGINLKACVTLTAIVGVLLYTCIDYLRVKSDVTSMSKVVATKETEVNELKAKNDSSLKEVEATINLQDIYETATQDLGMVFSNDNKIIKYEGSESTYVEQYEDLPEEYKKSVYEDVLSALENY